MADLIERLRAALSEAYVIERELGGGGMSRVFQAEERTLGRKVVIKALPPEIAAAVSSDRFRREIQLAASLQHPHIVPVLATGQADDILWYSMPLVEGQSLRVLLERDGALPPAMVVRLLRDIADALEHAHGKGVVHRDIKPENILLSGNHAVVTDFGIAKALVTARHETGSGVTTEGLVIGTPAYMAPEQAAGDPGVDQRADLYALGAVAYEMLAGRPVFSRPTPQALIAAHITETPPPLPSAHPAIPTRLAQLVMLCLHKEPVRRPTAFAIRTTLETLAPAGPASRRRHLTVGAGVMALFLGGASYAMGLWPPRSLVTRGILSGHDRILVASVENRTSDSTLGLALTQALRVDLTQSDIMRVVGDQEIREALSRAQREPGALMTETLSREIAQREGIKAVVTANVTPVGSGYVLTANILAPGDGRVLAAVRETARNESDLIEALGRLSRQLRRKTGESLKSIAATPPLERVSTSSLEALKKYSLAVSTIDVARDLDRAEALLREAIAIDSGFAMAWRKLGIKLSNEGKRAPSVAALTAAYRNRERLVGTERIWTEASYYGSVTFETDRAIGAYRAIIDAAPMDWRAINNLALQYQRNGQLPQAESLLRRVVAIDSTRLNPITNLVDVLVDQGRLAAADSMLARGAQRFPEDPSIGWSELQIRYQQGGVRAAESTLARMLVMHGEDRDLRKSMLWVQGLLAATRGTLQVAGRRFQAARREALATNDLQSFHDIVLNEASLQILLRGKAEQGTSVMERSLQDHPISAMEPLDRPYLEYAYNYAHAGEFEQARRMVAEFERIPPDLRRREEGFRLSTTAMIAMGEGRFDEALAIMDGITRADGCVTCIAAERALIWDRAGHPDSAMVYFERVVEMHQASRVYADAFYLASALRRLGELHEQAGNRSKALEYYGRFADLWKDADPEFQPRVTEVKRRMAALAAEP